MSPRARKPAAPPKRGRGRPAIGPRYETRLDASAEEGVRLYLADVEEEDRAIAGRDLLAAYAESPAVRAAIGAWRAKRV